MATNNSRAALYAFADAKDPVDRTKQPYRIYKPLFLDENHFKRDLDREFESISQALIWVTNSINIVVENVNVLLAIHEKPPIVLPYPDQK
ncbi:hypothetical protein GAP52_021 [Cronobacter phage vB_CsaP_GAP52]|uniref:Uncharacterized protein n=1 Tax=Cronobacter phage vB_CsaP_GAP52 TaxID=1141137 RepID=K4FBA7_9CAUD|nr:hypothetical protein D858_gp095 [Cronobacter phage vB_CsaP_GAP52]AFC22014.1 hypothetical protein GAP52_021 [Cronobacter phage vB_CsaP_GAP52]